MCVIKTVRVSIVKARTNECTVYLPFRPCLQIRRDGYAVKHGYDSEQIC